MQDFSSWGLVVLIACVPVVAAQVPSEIVVDLPDDLAGWRIVSAGPAASVKVSFVESVAGFTNFLSLSSPREQFIFSCKAPPAEAVDLGTFLPGEELVLRLVSPQGVFLSGPGSRNPDGVVHASVHELRVNGDLVGLRTGFEDLLGGGDQDYDDCLFNVRGPVFPVHPGLPLP